MSPFLYQSFLKSTPCKANGKIVLELHLYS